MKALLVLFLLVPSLSWAEKIFFRCWDISGYFLLKDNLFTTTLIHYQDNGDIFYYEKTDENDVFINFKYKKMKIPEENKTGINLLIYKLKEKDVLKYNKLNSNLIIRDKEKHYCDTYDENK